MFTGGQIIGDTYLLGKPYHIDVGFEAVAEQYGALHETYAAADQAATEEQRRVSRAIILREAGNDRHQQLIETAAGDREILAADIAGTALTRYVAFLKWPGPASLSPELSTNTLRRATAVSPQSLGLWRIESHDQILLAEHQAEYAEMLARLVQGDSLDDERAFPAPL